MKKVNLLCILIAFIFVAGTISASTEILVPNGLGYYNSWRAYGCGTNKWQCVDEPVVNNSDYIYFSSSYLGKITFPITNTAIPNNSVISAVRINYTGKGFVSLWNEKKKFYPVLRLNGQEYIGGALQLVTLNMDQYSSKIVGWGNNPFNAQLWTIDDINNLEVGVIASDTKNGGGIISDIDVLVIYSAN